MQRGPEELHQAVTEHEVEDVLGELYLFSGVQQTGRDKPVTPGRQLTAGHLVQGDGRSVKLSRLVVTAPAAEAEERVEIVVRAQLKFGIRNACEREIEKNQLAALARQLTQGQVVRLDIAVPDPPAVEELERLEQVLAESLQLVNGQRAVLAELVGKGVVAHVLDGNDRAIRETYVDVRVEKAGHVRVGELAELFRFAGQPTGGGLVERDLEDALAVVILGNQQRARGGPLAEHPLDFPARDLVTRTSCQRIGYRACVRAGEVFLDLVQVFEELPDRFGPVGEVDRRRVAYQRVHGRSDRIGHLGGGQCVFDLQPLAEPLTALRWW